MAKTKITLQTEYLEAASVPTVVKKYFSTENIADCLKNAGEWFLLDVANGDAREDTIKTYLTHLNHWLSWCHANNINPALPSNISIKAFRQELVQAGAAHATISLKLTTIRRFYDAAVARGLINNNPAIGIKAPRDRSASSDNIKCLSAGEAELLFRAIPRDHRLKSLRDRAIVALMMLEGLRRIEISRANVDDLEVSINGSRMLVRGKGKDGYIYPRDDTLDCINTYLSARSVYISDNDGIPLFVSLSKNGKEQRRISRIGLSKWMDQLLLKADISKSGRACHALRHTCGALLYQATRDVKVVQETLRHLSIAMAAKYSHIEDRGKARYTKSIPVNV